MGLLGELSGKHYPFKVSVVTCVWLERISTGATLCLGVYCQTKVSARLRVTSMLTVMWGDADFFQTKMALNT